MPAIIGRRGPCASLSWPATTMPSTLATRKAVNAQPNALSPCSSRAAVGNAGPTAIASKAIIVMSVISPPLAMRSRPEKIDVSSASSSGTRSATRAGRATASFSKLKST